MDERDMEQIDKDVYDEFVGSGKIKPPKGWPAFDEDDTDNINDEIQNTAITNARQYPPLYKIVDHIQTRKLIRVILNRIIKRLKIPTRKRSVDDYDWESYDRIYKKQQEDEINPFYTTDLDSVDFRIIDGKIFIICDSKPIHFSHRSVIEAVINLPNVKSICEIGCGCGFFLNLLSIVFEHNIRLSATEINPGQLCYFDECYPDIYNDTKILIHDITSSPVPTELNSDVVFESTVLMHINPRERFLDGLKNVLLSSNRFSILNDNWITHDYYNDLIYVKSITRNLKKCNFYYYDSGAQIVIVASINGEKLDYPYKILEESILKKYQ